MNELSLLGGIELDIAKDTAELMVERLKKAVIEPNRLTSAEELRTEANKLIKGYEASIEEGKEELIKVAFGEQLEKVNGFLIPLKDQAKEYASSVLEAKKAKEKEKCRELFDTFNDGGDDGEIFDFDEMYNSKWGDMKQIDRIKAIKETLDKERRKCVRERVTIVLDANIDQIKSLEAFLKKEGIEYARI